MQRASIEAGRRLKALREMLEMSQADLANKLGVSQKAISQWERGERDIPTTMLLKLHELTGVNLHWLLTGEGEPFAHPTQEDEEFEQLIKSIPHQYREQIKEIFKSILFIAGLESAKKGLKEKESSTHSTKSTSG